MASAKNVSYYCQSMHAIIPPDTVWPDTSPLLREQHIHLSYLRR